MSLFVEFLHGSCGNLYLVLWKMKLICVSYRSVVIIIGNLMVGNTFVENELETISSTLVFESTWHFLLQKLSFVKSSLFCTCYVLELYDYSCR